MLPIFVILGVGLLYLASRPSAAPAQGTAPPRALPAGSPPTKSQCEAAFASLPAPVQAKVKEWQAAGGAANLKMAASYLELGASSAVEPIKTNMLLVASCLRTEAAAAPTDFSTVDCATALAGITKMNPTYAPVLAKKDPAELKVLSNQLKLWLPSVTDPTLRANLQRGIECVDGLVVAAPPVDAGGGKDCLTDDKGMVIPNTGLSNLLVMSPKLAEMYADMAMKRETARMRSLAKGLRTNCQSKAAAEVEAAADALDTAPVTLAPGLTGDGSPGIGGLGGLGI